MCHILPSSQSYSHRHGVFEGPWPEITFQSSSICLCSLLSRMSCFSAWNLPHVCLVEVTGFVSFQWFRCYWVTKAIQGRVCSPSSSSTDPYFLSLAQSISGQRFEQPWLSILIVQHQRPFYKLSFVPQTRLPASWIPCLTDSLTYAAPLNIYANVVRPLKTAGCPAKTSSYTYKVKMGMSFSWEGRKYLKFKMWNL